MATTGFPASKVFACAVALIGLGASGYGLVDSVRAWPLQQEAFKLESGAHYRQLPERESIVDPQLPKPAGFCNLSTLRALVTVRLAVVDALDEAASFDKLDDAWADTVGALRALLACSPLDGNAWLRLAMVEVERQGPTRAVLDALKASYLTAPADLWVMRVRLPFALRLLGAGIHETDRQTSAETDVVMAQAFNADIVRIYMATPPEGRAPLEERLRTFPPQRYAAIYRALKAAGSPPDPQKLPEPPPPPPRYPR